MATKKQLRYAVVGLGHIAQAAVLPAFANAQKNSVLTAFVSDDPQKHAELGPRYNVEHHYSYDQYEDLLRSGLVDAVYIALPNNMHCEYAARAAEAGIHVLCEKPMALTEEQCHEMIHSAEQTGVKLMIAYRLHFEKANLKAIDVVQSGQIGEPRFFQSTFCMQVKEGNIRVQQEMGGGTLWDIGIYCLNAARYLFAADPVEVFAFTEASNDPRFSEVDEMTSAVLRFPGHRLAAFTCSFGAADISSYRVVGAKGDLRVEPAYEYVGKLSHQLTIDGKTTKKTFAARDQFAPELIYFSDCVLKNKKPEPSGEEGLADVRIINALYDSAREGRPIQLDVHDPSEHPSMDQEIERPPVEEPPLVNVEAPHQ